MQHKVRMKERKDEMLKLCWKHNAVSILGVDTSLLAIMQTLGAKVLTRVVARRLLA